MLFERCYIGRGKKKIHPPSLRESYTVEEEKKGVSPREGTDVCFVAALMDSDRFRLCNDVKKSDMRPRVKTA